MILNHYNFHQGTFGFRKRAEMIYSYLFGQKPNDWNRFMVNQEIPRSSSLQEKRAIDGVMGHDARIG
jgi:hypothetical protein